MLITNKVFSIMIKVLSIAACVFVILYCASSLIFIRPFLIQEKFVESFDKHYVYTQLSSPKKTLCTVVILENKDFGREPSYTLPYFNDRTIRKIAWGLDTNDLFVYSSDSGLAVYRNINDIWTECYLWLANNSDGTYTYYLYHSIDGKIVKHSEISSDTIPDDIKTLVSEAWQKYGDEMFKATNE